MYVRFVECVAEKTIHMADGRGALGGLGCDLTTSRAADPRAFAREAHKENH